MGAVELTSFLSKSVTALLAGTSRAIPLPSTDGDLPPELLDEDTLIPVTVLAQFNTTERLVQYLRDRFGDITPEFNTTAFDAADAPASKQKRPRQGLKDDVMDEGLEACKRGDLPTLRQLVAGGWDVETTDRFGSPGLHW
jgi:hypothetical protein